MKMNGYSKYEIYPETGMVFSYKTNSYIGSDNGDGYLSSKLTDDNGIQHRWLIHRLIWTAVNGEIPEGMQINHIDENTLNNSIYNLNLMTAKENNNWGTRTQRASLKKFNHPQRSKPIVALQDGNIKMYFPSTMEAQRMGFSQGNIGSCCNGKRLTHKGYSWLFLDTYLSDWWDKEYMI